MKTSMLKLYVYLKILREKETTDSVALLYNQFQHFYVRIFHTQVVLVAFSSYVYVEKASEMTFVQKMCA